MVSWHHMCQKRHVCHKTLKSQWKADPGPLSEKNLVMAGSLVSEICNINILLLAAQIKHRNQKRLMEESLFWLLVLEPESIIIQGNGGRPLEQQAGKSHLQPQTQNPEWSGSEAWLQALKACPQWLLPPERLSSTSWRFHKLSQQDPQLLTKCSDTWACEGHFLRTPSQLV